VQIARLRSAASSGGSGGKARKSRRASAFVMLARQRNGMSNASNPGAISCGRRLRRTR
jgi:hypothetical protein